LFFVGPENVYVHVPAELDDSFKANVPSGVLPSGLPAVTPSESVTQRLIAVSVGRPDALTT